VRGGDQFLGVRPHAIFETGAERILRIFEDSARGDEGTFSVFEAAFPGGGSFSIHSLMMQ
jgi:hypothetical protein